MDDWWYRRRRRSPSSDDFDDVLREFLEDLERILRGFSRAMPEELTPDKLDELIREWEKQGYKPFVYGFEFRIGPDGKPIVREFGNVRKMGGRPTIMEEREPLVDVFESNEEITVAIEMPGVEKDKIDVRVSEDGKQLIVSASDTNRRYHKEIDLPAKVDPQSAKASYKNGVLEVKLKKVFEPKSKGFKVNIE